MPAIGGGGAAVRRGAGRLRRRRRRHGADADDGRRAGQRVARTGRRRRGVPLEPAVDAPFPERGARGVPVGGARRVHVHAGLVGRARCWGPGGTRWWPESGQTGAGGSGTPGTSSASSRAGVRHDLPGVEARRGGRTARPEVVGGRRVALVELERRRGGDGEVRLLVLRRDRLGQRADGEPAQRGAGPGGPSAKRDGQQPRAAHHEQEGGRAEHGTGAAIRGPGDAISRGRLMRRPPRGRRRPGRRAGRRASPTTTIRPCTTTATSVATPSAVAANCSARITATPSAAIWATSVVELGDDHRGEAHGDLVEQEDGRLHAERARHGQHLLLAARERAGHLVAALGQTGEAGEGQLLDVRPGGAGERHEPEVLGHGEVGEDAAAVGQGAEPGAGQRVGAHAVGVAPEDVEAAPGRHHLAAGHTQRRRLAGPVGSEQGQHRTARDREVDAVQHLDLPVGGVDPPELQHGGLSHGRPAAAGPGADCPARRRRRPPAPRDRRPPPGRRHAPARRPAPLPGLPT